MQSSKEQQEEIFKKPSYLISAKKQRKAIEWVRPEIPPKKKCKKAKWLSEEDLQIAEKREAKSKEERER